MPYSNLLPNFTTADKEEVLQLIEACFVAMPFLVSTSKKEKAAQLKMGNKAVLLCASTYSYPIIM